MEPNWGLYSNHYSGDRQPPVSPHQDRQDDQPPSHRRSMNQGTFLPPPPPQSQSSGLTLPPVSASYGSGSNYYGSSPSTMGMGSASAGQGSTGPSTSDASSTAPMHMAPGMPYSPHMSVSQHMGTYHYPMQSAPATMSTLPSARTAQPHGYSPRIPSGYPTASPGMNPLSPLSPSTHIGYAGPSSSSTSASSFPPSVPPPHSKVDLPSVPHGKRRQMSGDSMGSWDDDERRDDDEQPWGMPQDQYKALNPKDKKQVRNRIGARRFRAKRKDYVSQLEATKKDHETKIHRLQVELEASRREINDLRGRLNMAPLPPPNDAGSLGLVVSNNNNE